MTPGRRIALAAVMAALVIAGVAGVAMLGGKAPREPEGPVSVARASPAAAPDVRGPPGPASPAAASPATAVSGAPAAPASEAATSTPEAAAPVERPIEEVLADSGEDPGAVYFMSRVREALREGNPAFARELLRQMKEAQPNSVLIEEAEALFVRGR